MVFIEVKITAYVLCALCILYKGAARKRHVLNWGSSKQTHEIKTVLKNMYKSNTINYHVKNFLPNVMVLSGKPESRKKLISFASIITKNNSLQICVNVEKKLLSIEQKKNYLHDGILWLKKAGIKSLYTIIDNIEMDVAAQMVYTCSHGQFRPNIILIGYKSDWLNCSKQELKTYLNIFNIANITGIATIMVRVSSTEGIKNQNLLVQDFKNLHKQEEIPFKPKPNQNNQNRHKVSDYFISIKEDDEYSFINNKKKKRRETVDVWWLYNDEGLALIIAYILQTNSKWKSCKFRIFGVTNSVESLSKEKNKLKQLLTLYRIHFDYIEIILSSAVDPTTLTYFSSLLKLATVKENNIADFKTQQEDVAETLFLRDLIELHSYKSSMIILTTPKTNDDMNVLFMCWIETITRGLPPCIIINGSTGPVLTTEA